MTEQELAYYDQQAGGQQTIKVKTKGLQEVSIQRLAEKELEKVAPYTGWEELDESAKGFIPGHIYTVTGDTNVGKTSLACNFAANVARQGKKILYISLEPDCTVADYFASVFKDKPFDKLTPEDYQFENKPIEYLDKNAVRSPEALISAIESNPRYDLIIVDHIGYFVTNTNNTNQEQSNVIKKLAGMAKKYQTAIMIIAHMKKPQTKREGFPSMDDISGSASFKQDSTDVWIVTKDKDESDPTGNSYTDEGWLMVSKSKTGSNVSIRLKFAKKSAYIYPSKPSYLR
jgi:replicative DNA helicase